MEDSKGGVLVRGFEEEIVMSASEIFTLIERGYAKRRTAETLLNKQSRLSFFCKMFTISHFLLTKRTTSVHREVL
ncbi:putative kinesin-like protein [Helianthus anomalus]